MGTQQKDDSINPGVFRGLINFVSKLDPDLTNYLETSMVSKMFLRKFRMRYLTSCYKYTMRKQGQKLRKFTVLWQMLNEEIFELFGGFFIPENQTEDGISKRILEQLDIILQGN